MLLKVRQKKYRISIDKKLLDIGFQMLDVKTLSYLTSDYLISNI